MALGSVQNVLICQPVPVATAADQTYCPIIGGQAFAPRSTVAYILDPASVSNLEAAIAPFDYSYAAGIWAFGFSTIVGLFVMSHGIGHVLGMIRRG
jgi:hypothetical protein